jgi:hypothetical protein
MVIGTETGFVTVMASLNFYVQPLSIRSEKKHKAQKNLEEM